MQISRVSTKAAVIGGTLVLTCFVTLSVAAQQRSDGSRPSLKGTWRFVEWTGNNPGAKLTTNVPSLLVFTDKYMMWAAWPNVKPAAELPSNAQATDKDKADAWTAFNVRAGTYEVTGSEVKMNRSSVGGFDIMRNLGSTWISWTYKLSGDTLQLTLKANQNGPFPQAGVTNPIPGTFKLVRLE